MPTTATPRSPASAEALLLEITPPRAPRHLLPRPRLALGDPRFAGAPLLVVQAPPGFGKTSLLAQWRLEFLSQGAAVAWLQSQPSHDPSRLVQALTLAVRHASGRPAFGHTLLDSVPPDGLEAVTVWLAEVAHLAVDVVLMVDEAERLPEQARVVLSYLLHNTPPNLRVVVAARPDVDLGVEDLVDYGQCQAVNAGMLRFTLDETLALSRARLGARFDVDIAARLHELTEGWPLGVQLALAAAPATDGPAPLPVDVREGLRGRFVALLLTKLAPPDLDFLTRIAVLDVLHPALCAALTGAADAPDRLARLTRDTPVFVAGEQGEWLHMHALAREALRERFAGLPAAERAELHRRAARWLADQGLIDAAAEHALAAGQREQAYELAERGLYESFMSFGQHQAVLDWLRRLPADELQRRPGLLLAAAWSLAVSERHDEARQLVERLLDRAGDDAALRCECALILGGAAVFADDPDRFAALHDPWAERPPLQNPVLLQIHANRSAFRALLAGDPAGARLRQQQAPVDARSAALGYVSRWGELIVGLTYLWEGQVQLAERLLGPTLLQAEGQLGRRSVFACMVASLLAAAVWEADRPAEAAALLANRLDVLERHGMPETVLLGYRTMARIAVDAGAEHRALELLGALFAVGRARALPRLCVVSLSDQVRMHARRFRAETCRALVAQIDALLAEPALPQGPMWRRSVQVLHEVAKVYAAIAAQDWRGTLDAVGRAQDLVSRVRQGRLQIELLGLRAYALDRCGERPGPILREAVDLARAYGLKRVFVDAHPELGELVRRHADGEAEAEARVRVAPPRAAAAEPPRERVTASTALTPKEREVLGLLVRNLSNKEIGLALQVGEETIKWHMKNLFAKLDAGNRKQVVSRARILGLLEFES